MKSEKILLDRSTLERVAKNARLTLSEKEIQTFLPQLQDFLDVFAQLQEVDVKDVPPSFQPFLIENVTRKDIVQPSLPNDVVVKLSPHEQKPYIKGPQVM